MAMRVARPGRDNEDTSMQMRRMAQTGAYALLLVAALVYALLGIHAWSKAHQARKDAEILLSEVRRLSPGESPAAVAEAIVHRHKAFLMKNDPSGRENVQYFDFKYDNGLLSRLYLAPYATFGVRLQIVDRNFDVSFVGIASANFRHYYTADLSDFPRQALPGKPGYHLTNRDNWISIYLKPSATQEQRKQAYSFNLKCLDKIGGCHDEKELLPGPWQTIK
jgi:hypothetical protein